MKALLLAAGLGTRLRPITDTTPKCLVPIGGKPLLGIWLSRLSEANFGPFFINTHYLPEQVESYLKGLGDKYLIHEMFEPELLGTAGTLLNSIHYFDGQDLLVAHADNFCLADFNAFRKAHESRPKSCLMTMMTFQTSDPTKCGIVNIDGSNIVQTFYEKVENPPGNLANGAVYMLSPEMISVLGKNFSSAKDVSTEILPNFLGKIYTYRTNETLIDIGTKEALSEAQLIAADKK